MKLIKSAGVYHLEDCRFPFEDQALCNCPHIEVEDLDAKHEQSQNEEFATKKEVKELKEDIKEALDILSIIIKYNNIK